MTEFNPEYIAFIAATITTISFIPQAVKVIATKNTEAISLWMYILFTIGVVLWGTYGVFVDSPSIIIANIVMLPFAAIILIIKVKNERR